MIECPYCNQRNLNHREDCGFCGGQLPIHIAAPGPNVPEYHFAQQLISSMGTTGAMGYGNSSDACIGELFPFNHWQTRSEQHWEEMKNVSFTG